MKFVGATDWFIRVPFVLEGVIIGICGGIFAFLMVIAGYGFLTSSFASMLEGMNIFTIIMPAGQIAPVLIWSFLIFGILIGGAGSFISVRKHLHV
jgi:cell division transport system permease protein